MAAFGKASGVPAATLAGLKALFDAMLGSHLLYTFERVQFAEILAAHPNTPLADLYGAEHLLRFCGAPFFVLFLFLFIVIKSTPP